MKSVSETFRLSKDMSHQFLSGAQSAFSLPPRTAFAVCGESETAAAQDSISAECRWQMPLGKCQSVVDNLQASARHSYPENVSAGQESCLPTLDGLSQVMGQAG